MTRWIARAGFSLLLATTVGAWAQSTTETRTTDRTQQRQQQFQEAQRAFQSGRTSESVTLLRAFVKQEPTNEDARIALARSLAAAKSFAEATREIEGVLTRQPESADALLVRGQIELWREKPAAARPYLEKALEVAPQYCDVYVALSNSWLWSGDRAKAQEVLNQGRDQCSTYTVFLEQIEKLQKPAVDREATRPVGQGDPTPVATTPDEVSTAPDRAAMRKVEGNIAEVQPVTEGREIARRKAGSRIDYDALVRQARDILNAGDIGCAEQVIDYILNSKPGYADAMLLKGQVHLRRKQFPEAGYWFQRIIQDVPEYCDAYYGLSNAFIGMKDVVRAREVVFARPECVCTAEGIAQQGRVANAEGQYAEAKALFAQAISMQPDNSDYREAYQATRLFTNSFITEYESFRQTGSQFYLGNFLGYRPCKEWSYLVIAERFYRFKSSDTRLGGGVTWHPCEDLWLYAQALQALEERVVPSRYETELTYRVFPEPGTFLLAGVALLKSQDSRTLLPSLGVRQALTEYLSITYRHYWAQSLTGGEDAATDQVRLDYEQERERRIAIGYAWGGEAFQEERVGAGGASSGTYDAQSVFLNWREWICEDWGLIFSASATQRSTGNDSRMIGAGVFFEF